VKICVLKNKIALEIGGLLSNSASVVRCPDLRALCCSCETYQVRGLQRHESLKSSKLLPDFFVNIMYLF
jgi:hypothetical protein